MDLKTIIADAEALIPALNAIASAVNPAVGATLVAAEQVIPVVQRLITEGQAILAAKNGIDPVLWDQIVAENNAADAAFDASGRPSA